MCWRRSSYGGVALAAVFGMLLLNGLPRLYHPIFNAKDFGLNLLSWYIYTLGGLFTIGALIAGGVDTGWTFYTPFSTMFFNTRKRIFGYRFMAYPILGIATIGCQRQKCVCSHTSIIAS